MGPGPRNLKNPYFNPVCIKIFRGTDPAYMSVAILVWIFLSSETFQLDLNNQLTNEILLHKPRCTKDRGSKLDVFKTCHK